ncbi:hypothetical protein COL154_009079 [Colletotrichum chrysophilum]|nr:hypothetical protein COL154_009079 [Colletotrichum chrysophilum]
MATVLAKDPLQKGEGAESTASLEGIPPLGAPKEEKRFFFQRDKYYDPFAIATQVILYLSYFYKHHELSLRLGFFWTAMSIADILSALLAYGLLHMRGLQGHAGWRWLFLIEGLLTLVIGIFGFLLMPAGPCQTASWFRGQKAEVFKELTFIAMSGQFWTLPFLIYLNVVDTTEVNRWVLYTVISLLLIYPNAHPIQTSGIISSNIYRSDDAPLYKRGNRALLGIVCMNLVLYPLVKAYYVYRNKRRDKIWDGMSEEQRVAYLATTKDEGNKRLDFRFSH